MRILVYGINAPPELSGIGKFTGEMISELSRRHEVRLVTTAPHYPHWRVPEGYSSRRFETETHASGRLQIFRCPMWLPSKISGFTRLLHAASFAISSMPRAFAQIHWRPNVIIVVAPSLMVAPSAWVLGRLCGAKLWLHVQDFEVDAAFALGILKSKLAQAMVLRVEKFLMQRFDRVSTISEAMLERLLLKGIEPARRVLFPNWVDTSNIFPLEYRPAMRDELGVSNETVIVLYAGSMGEKQGLEVLLDAAILLEASTQIHFVLCGAGGVRAALQERYRALTNITWLHQQPIERLNDLLNCADMHALPQRADAADLVMPSKLTGMMASGRPTVASSPATSELALALVGAGLLVPPGDAGAFAEAIRELANKPHLRHQLGAAARQIAELRMSKSSVIAKFEADLSSLEVDQVNR
jgi:colanic acid biosynthesis glycosyl transferase WcaI